MTALTTTSHFDIVPILKEVKKDFKFVPGTNEIVMDCPVCGKEDHFYYNRKKNLCICQRCKYESNHIGFLIVGLGYSKKDAATIVFGVRESSLTGIKGRIASLTKTRFTEEEISHNPIFFKNPLPEGTISVSKKAFPKALSERGIDLKTAMDLNIGLCNTPGKFFNRIIFPIATLKTKTFTATSGFTKTKVKKIKEIYKERYKDKPKGRRKKYRKSLFPFGSIMSEVLYSYNDLMEKHIHWLFVNEGIFDAFRIRKYGYDSTCSFGDKVSFSQVVLLSNLDVDEIILMLDGSVDYARLWKYICLLEEICYDKDISLCVPIGEKDPDELSKKEFLYCLEKRRIRGSFLARMSKNEAKKYMSKFFSDDS